MLVAVLPAQPAFGGARCEGVPLCARARALARSLAPLLVPSPPSPPLPSPPLPPALPSAPADTHMPAPAPAPASVAASVYFVYMFTLVSSFLHFHVTLLGELYSSLQYCWVHLKTICADPCRWKPIGLGPKSNCSWMCWEVQLDSVALFFSRLAVCDAHVTVECSVRCSMSYVRKTTNGSIDIQYGMMFYLPHNVNSVEHNWAGSLELWSQNLLQNCCLKFH